MFGQPRMTQGFGEMVDSLAQGRNNIRCTERVGKLNTFMSEIMRIKEVISLRGRF